MIYAHSSKTNNVTRKYSFNSETSGIHKILNNTIHKLLTLFELLGINTYQQNTSFSDNYSKTIDIL